MGRIEDNCSGSHILILHKVQIATSLAYAGSSARPALYHSSLNCFQNKNESTYLININAMAK